jgi:apolipoprotein N-acyltransferase
LTVSDAYGRIIAEAVTSRGKPVTLVADVGLTSAGTLYSRVGDVFACLTVLIAIGLLGWCALRQRDPDRAHSPLATQEG